MNQPNLQVPTWNLPPVRDAVAETKALKDDRIDYAWVSHFYHRDPGTLTMPEFLTLREGVKWIRNIEKGEHPEGSWMERNSVPGSVTVIGSGLNLK